jgi:hypothetical protein
MIIRDDWDSQWFLISTGTIGTLGLMIIPLIIFFISLKMDPDALG